VEDRAALRVLRGHVGEGHHVCLDAALLKARHQAPEDLRLARAAAPDHDASSLPQEPLDGLVLEGVVRAAAESWLLALDQPRPWMREAALGAPPADVKEGDPHVLLLGQVDLR